MPPQSIQRLPKGWTVWGSILAPVLPGAESHPTSSMMDTWCFPGTKRLGRTVDHLPPSSSEFVNGLDIYIHLPYVHTEACNGTTFTFTRFFTTVLYSMDTGTRYPGGKSVTYRHPVFRVRMNAAADLLHTHSFNLWQRDNLYLYLYLYNFIHVSVI